MYDEIGKEVVYLDCASVELGLRLDSAHFNHACMAPWDWIDLTSAQNLAKERIDKDRLCNFTLTGIGEISPKQVGVMDTYNMG